MEELYDIGKLKDNPRALHYLAGKLNPLDIGSDSAWDFESEVYKVLWKLCNSLWANIPPVVVYDFRDPDDPNTWGDFGPPPECQNAMQSDEVTNDRIVV